MPACPAIYRRAAPLLGATVSLATAAAACNPRVAQLESSAADLLLPPEQEAQLAAQVDRQLHQELSIVQDPAIAGYVEQVGDRVAAASAGERGPVAVHFEVVDDPTQVNAFATVGGNIYVYTGLLLAARSEAELASVLAHEVGHVANRDVARGLVARYGLGLLARAALGDEPGAVAAIATQLAGAGAIAAHTREQERAADRAGVRYLATAGYDPSAMASMFGTLESLRGGSPGAVEAFFSTHPAPGDRREAIAREIQALGSPRGETGSARHARALDGLRRDYAARGIRIG